MDKAVITNDVLKSWDKLNACLQNCTEAAAQSLLKEELKGRKRKQFLLRIHSRINKLRASRERMELMARSKPA